MKLRFRQNSLRLRVNRREVEGLSTGQALRECVHFPGGPKFTYVLENTASGSPQVQFEAGTVRVAIPAAEIRTWADNDEIGIYFDLAANGATLKVAVEKDLECIDGTPEEHDPDAYARSGKNC